jgi:glyceraldehyde-3-phosphate dehydrogenase/erythrose-4-phosphate dehydrogenase
MCSVISDDSGGRRSMVKTLTWYDNGLSYAHRIVSLISKMSATF